MLVQARGSLYLASVLLALAPAAASAEPELGPDRAGFVIELGLDPAGAGLVLGLGPDNPAARCMDQDRQARKKSRRGVLGWLYRYTRNVDVERGNTPVPLYLRSPLLTAVPLPDCDSVPGAPTAEQCAVVAVNPVKDVAFDAMVPLPQLDAHTPARLSDAILRKLELGESIELLTSTGSTIELTPPLKHVETRNCVIDA